MEKVEIIVDGQKVSGTLIYPEKLLDKNPACIFIHGWKSNQNGYVRRAKFISKLGIICLTIDLRGHGKSDGNIDDLSRTEHLKDVVAAYDYLTSLPIIDQEKIGVVGASYGGALATLLTSKRQIKWLGMRAPALFNDKFLDVPTTQLVKDENKFFKQQKWTPQENSTLKAFHEFKGDILLIESEKDAVIPHQVIENYLNAASDKSKLTYIVMKDAEHNLSKDVWQTEFINILLEWFKTRLSAD